MMDGYPDFSAYAIAGFIAMAICIIVACWALVEAVIWIWNHVSLTIQ
jgi:hypothetical protein